MSEIPKTVSIQGQEYSVVDTGEWHDKLGSTLYQLIDKEGKFFTHPLLSMIVAVALNKSVNVVDLSQGKMTIRSNKR